MNPALDRTFKRASAGLMLALALVYLIHAAWHTAAAEVAVHPSGAAVVMELDPFLLAQAQSGDGVAGCHFFCNHGCPVPPLPDQPRLVETPPARVYTLARTSPARCAHPQPIKAPPRLLA